MKKFIRLFKIAIITIIIFTTSSFANTLNLAITTAHHNIKVGKEFKIKVDWNEDMQAADFTLEYDSDKVEYISCNIEDSYINKSDGKIKISWFSLDNKDKDCIDFKFKAKKVGNVLFNTKTDGGFATGELNTPDEYKDGTLELKIKDSNNMFIYYLILFIILIILIFTFIIKKKNKRKTRRQKNEK